MLLARCDSLLPLEGTVNTPGAERSLQLRQIAGQVPKQSNLTGTAPRFPVLWARLGHDAAVPPPTPTRAWGPPHTALWRARAC